MRFYLFLFVLISGLSTAIAWADSDEPASASATPTAVSTPTPIVDKWNKEVISSLNLNQASFSNWQQGGTNFISWQADLNSKLERDNAAINWLNRLKLEYGTTDVEGVGTRKSADEISMESVLSWKTWAELNPFISFEGLTQFDSGFNYTVNPAGVQISAFLDPGYFTESAGLKYVPDKVFNTRLGLALKETVASQFNYIYTVNPDTGAIQNELTEFGLSSVSELNLKLSPISSFSSKLDMFWNGRALDRTVVSWENLLSLSLNKIITINAEDDFRYDPVAYNGWQFKETLGIGVAYSLL